VVRDESLYAVVEKRIRDCCAEQGLTVKAWFESPIQGGDGNREFFVEARRAA
jgi:23S rRNA (cytidine1920-2'-O)/16S rRNA (cytidine1409-2'-O)-methyltransferase